MEILTVKDLIKALSKMNEDAQIVVGCQGYLSEYNADDYIRVNEVGAAVYITDCCYYAEIQEVKK